jgi:hypothetical protein
MSRHRWGRKWALAMRNGRCLVRYASPRTHAREWHKICAPPSSSIFLLSLIWGFGGRSAPKAIVSYARLGRAPRYLACWCVSDHGVNGISRGGAVSLYSVQSSKLLRISALHSPSEPRECSGKRI